MVFTRRRRRFTRRRHKFYKPRYRRRWRRRWHWGRRHSRRRWRKTEVVYEHRPRKRKRIVCTGWEILGVVGSHLIFTYDKDGNPTVTTTRNTKNNKQVTWQKDAGFVTSNNTFTPGRCTFASFIGGYGQGTFTLGGLCLRASLGMARFSDSFEGYDWVKYLGGSYQLVPNAEVDWLFRWDNHKNVGYDASGRDESKDEGKWNHPANLLLYPFVSIVESIKRSKCCKWKHRRFRPNPLWEGWWDKDRFATYVLGGYMWTTIDLDNPMGLAPYARDTGTESSAPLRNDWWPSNYPSQTQGKCPTWINRQEWDKGFLEDNQDNRFRNITWPLSGDKRPRYGPFCPPVLQTDRPQTLWFRYKFVFQFGGTNIENYFPRYPVSEVRDPPKTCPSGCQSCIGEGDLNSNGILTDDAYERITGADKHGRMERESAKTRLLQLIAKQLKKKRVKWGNVETRYY